jgi:hypothetical protein
VNITKENTYLSKVFLELIQMQDSFKMALQSAFPEMYADIESFKTNPNCTCRNKIEAYVNSHRNETHAFLDKWYNENKSLNINLEEIVAKYAVNNMGGKVYRIPRTDAAFAELQKKMIAERWVFRAFDIVAEPDTLIFYFL